MPTLPWIQPNTPAPGAEAVVMASRLQVRSLRQVPGFFLASMRLWRQARRSPGVWGVSLKAELLRGTFWTLSAWSGKDALYDYARADPHKSEMRRLRDVTAESTFVLWDVPVSDLPVGWEEARRRIAAEREVTRPA
ncbi:DUF3291 domain-containing protein [Spirillospora sp. NPDC047279]|uniref:DUF3291 domain-containing protein n=1 Tax=Spirillospora sp. NPDC047279 TaxID=3155478 RepID=UPI0033FF2C1A